MSSYVTLEEQVKVINETRPLVVRIPKALFEEVRASGKLSQVDIWIATLILRSLREEGFIK